MTLRQTHSFVEMEVSHATFMEIAGKLREAEYDHAFVDGAIDMHGIALVREPGPERPPACPPSMGGRVVNSDTGAARALGALVVGFALGLGFLAIVEFLF